MAISFLFPISSVVYAKCLSIKETRKELRNVVMIAKESVCVCERERKTKNKTKPKNDSKSHYESRCCLLRMKVIYIW